MRLADFGLAAVLLHHREVENVALNLARSFCERRQIGLLLHASIGSSDWYH